MVLGPLGPSATVVSETGFNLVGFVGNLCKLTTDCLCVFVIEVIYSMAGSYISTVDGLLTRITDGCVDCGY